MQQPGGVGEGEGAKKADAGSREELLDDRGGAQDEGTVGTRGAWEAGEGVRQASVVGQGVAVEGGACWRCGLGRARRRGLQCIETAGPALPMTLGAMDIRWCREWQFS